MALELTQEPLQVSENGVLGDYLKFSNGRTSPGDSPSGTKNIWGSNGVIGRTEESNSPENTIVIGRVGAYCGSVAFAKEESWVTDNAIKGSLHDTDDDPRFWYYKLSSMNLRHFSHGTSHPLINQSILNNLEVRVPPREERIRIAEILGSMDDKIEANSRLLDSLDELIRLEYLSSSDSSELKISDVATEVKDGVSPAEIADNEVYVGLEHLPRRNIWLREWGKGEDVTSNKSRFKQGDILFGKLRPYFHKVVVAPVDGICSTDIIVVRPKPGFEALTLQALSSDEVVAHATNASNGTRMPRTKWADLKDLDVRSATEVLEPSYTDYAVSLILENQSLSATRDLLIRHLIG